MKDPKKENVCFLSFSFLSFFFFVLFFSFFSFLSGRQDKLCREVQFQSSIKGIAITLLSSPFYIRIPAFKRQKGRWKAGRTCFFMLGMLQLKRAEEEAEKWAGMAYYDSIHGMMGMFLPFREMLNLVQKCCHKNFYISRDARYNQGKQGQEYCHKRMAECRKGRRLCYYYCSCYQIGWRSGR